MNRKITIILVAMVVIDIIDNDFATISILDAAKLALYLLCFALLITKERKEGKK